MDPRLKSLFDDFSGAETWRGKCIDKLRQAADNGANILGGIVGEDGVRDIAKGNWTAAQAWGVDINTCYEYCSRAKFPMVFNYQVFLGRATNYLLPWLALTAQLPFEAGDVMGNILSFCLALGSPALATYSLIITILNQNWLRRLCTSLPKFEKGKNQEPNPYTQRMAAARVLLEAAQQAPLRISDDDGTLSSLIILEDNRSWWNSVTARLEATKRTVTISLVAQMLVAVGAWILTVAGSFMSSLGDHTEALVLSSSALWTWLVPVIWGWIAVGTQNTSDTIERTLSEFTMHTAGQKLPTSSQRGFRVIDPHDPEERIPKFLIFSIPGDELQQGPTFNYARVFTWWCAAKEIHRAFKTVSVKYNERIPLDPPQEAPNPRPVSNLDAPTAVDKETTLHPLLTGQVNTTTNPDTITPISGTFQSHSPLIPNAPNAVNLPPSTLTPQDRAATFRMRSLTGTPSQLRTYISFPSPALTNPYPPWSEILSDSALIKRMIVASIFALAVQWGTTIPAIIIAYLTDVKGLGCRSGSYLVYGVAGTVAWGLLVLGGLVGHGAMIARQRMESRGEEGGLRVGETGRGEEGVVGVLGERADGHQNGVNGVNKHTNGLNALNGKTEAEKVGNVKLRSATHLLRKGPSKWASTLAFLSVTLRLSGKCVAIANAFWIILSSIWELVGFYDSCWCEGTVLATGSNSWIVLFKRAVDLSERAEGPWAGGVTMSFVVAFLSWLGFVLLCRDAKER